MVNSDLMKPEDRIYTFVSMLSGLEFGDKLA